MKEYHLITSKILPRLLTFSLILILLASCKKEEEEEIIPGKQHIPAELCGTWYEIDKGSSYHQYLTINEDGSVKAS